MREKTAGDILVIENPPILELMSDFHHWLRKCIEIYMVRNRAFWYCKTRISANSSEQGYCTET